MKAGGGKQKGAQFERDVCVRLSRWVSQGHKDDLFWRSAMSGGRATLGKRKGVDLSRQAGDITAVAPEGHILTDRFYIECKSVKDLKLDRMLIGSGTLFEFWRVARREAREHDRHPMLIAKQNQYTTLVLLPIWAMKPGNLFAHNIEPQALLTISPPNGGAYVRCAVLLFEDMLNTRFCKQYRTPRVRLINRG